MPVIGTAEPRALCPIGPARFRLKEVEQKAFEDYNDKTRMVDRLIWKFIDLSDRCAEDGTRYEVAIFTGMKYGNDKAKLTWLLDMVHPGISVDWIRKNGLDTDRYIDIEYEGGVKHVLSEDGSKKTATFTYLRPLGPMEPPTMSGVAASTVPAEPDFDVFSHDNPGAIVNCEVCGKELTDMEAIGCAKFWGDAHRFCAAHAKEQRLREAEALFATA